MVERVVLNALAKMPVRRLISAPSQIVNIGFGEADPPLIFSHFRFKQRKQDRGITLNSHGSTRCPQRVG
jgi:hypothetical protein